MSQNRSSGGIGFFGLLAIVFITLKLTGHILWSWWWVLAPLWFPAAVGVTVALGICICWLVLFLTACALELYEQYKADRRRRHVAALVESHKTRTT